MRNAAICLFAILLFGSCRKHDSCQEKTQSPPSARSCASNDVLEAQLKADPSLADRMEGIEAFTKRFIAQGGLARGSAAVTIPVVVHVLYNTNTENISNTQINSQIAVLNQDFNLNNSDRNKVPALFTNLRADVGVTFTLAQVIRKKTNVTSWGTNDAVKASNRGGSDAVDPDHYLNIWVCNLGQNLLGYAQFPGGSKATDGVVILYSAFGTVGTLIPYYDRGRTATHEIGHWMNLRHIWGDRTCGTDKVDDTPQATTANFNCPDYPHVNSCGDGAVEMTMNYMDYTDDACMYMFTIGQKARVLAVFQPGGPRAGFAP